MIAPSNFNRDLSIFLSLSETCPIIPFVILVVFYFKGKLDIERKKIYLLYRTGRLIIVNCLFYRKRGRSLSSSWSVVTAEFFFTIIYSLLCEFHISACVLFHQTECWDLGRNDFNWSMGPDCDEAVVHSWRPPWCAFTYIIIYEHGLVF